MGIRAKNGLLRLSGGTLDYIRFGTGEKTMVMIPGAGDGFKTVKGMALPFALLYRSLLRDFTVYCFSRGNALEAHTTREMAEELRQAMGQLGLRRTAVVGISQGGMIAQWLTIDHPDLAETLVLTVTAGRPNPTMTQVLERWIGMAKQGDYKGIMLDTALRSYTPKKYEREKKAYALLGNLGRPKDLTRFLIQAEACLRHDAYGELHRIGCPTLVIGGTEDGIVTGAASEELAEQIEGSELLMYRGLSHGLYEEAPDFWQRVGAFCSAEAK